MNLKLIPLLIIFFTSQAYCRDYYKDSAVDFFSCRVHGTQEDLNNVEEFYLPKVAHLKIINYQKQVTAKRNDFSDKMKVFSSEVGTAYSISDDDGVNIEGVSIPGLKAECTKNRNNTFCDNYLKIKKISGARELLLALGAQEVPTDLNLAANIFNNKIKLSKKGIFNLSSTKGYYSKLDNREDMIRTQIHFSPKKHNGLSYHINIFCEENYVLYNNDSGKETLISSLNDLGAISKGKRSKAIKSVHPLPLK